jgi:hypothetical protein
MYHFTTLFVNFEIIKKTIVNKNGCQITALRGATEILAIPHDNYFNSYTLWRKGIYLTRALTKGTLGTKTDGLTS